MPPALNSLGWSRAALKQPRASRSGVASLAISWVLPAACWARAKGWLQALPRALPQQMPSGPKEEQQHPCGMHLAGKLLSPHPPGAPHPLPQPFNPQIFAWCCSGLLSPPWSPLCISPLQPAPHPSVWGAEESWRGALSPQRGPRVPVAPRGAGGRAPWSCAPAGAAGPFPWLRAAPTRLQAPGGCCPLCLSPGRVHGSQGAGLPRFPPPTPCPSFHTSTYIHTAFDTGFYGHFHTFYRHSHYRARFHPRNLRGAAH